MSAEKMWCVHQKPLFSFPLKICLSSLCKPSSRQGHKEGRAPERVLASKLGKKTENWVSCCTQISSGDNKVRYWDILNFCKIPTKDAFPRWLNHTHHHSLYAKWRLYNTWCWSCQPGQHSRRVQYKKVQKDTLDQQKNVQHMQNWSNKNHTKMYCS